ncbi:MAG: 3-oxoacyl-[acyl-carrier protein] reductase [Solirubrobacteraceae bacterium]|nr:3-oxoacyl-[acyl-carrier protein] reductase [Solirubrobacteraceae bacterium]
MDMLTDKNAIIYGGGGAIGGAVARAFGAAGANVFVCGRTQEKLDAVAADCAAAVAVLDAYDEAAVEAHAASVGRIDVSMNVISDPYTHGVSLLEMSVDDYVAPPAGLVRTKFITARAAARRMVEQPDGGVILTFGGTGAPPRDYKMGGTQVAFDAVESMRRQFSTELGPRGVRWITLITSGIPGSASTLPEEVRQGMVDGTLTGREVTLEDVGAVAAFAASDGARSLTAATLNVSAGAIVDF